MEPTDVSKYEFIRLPLKEQWGVLVRTDSPLDEKICRIGGFTERSVADGAPGIGQK